jgi:hypothetical protein
VIVSRRVRYDANVGEKWHCVQGFDSKNFKQDIEVDGLVSLIVKCFLKRQGNICGQDSSGARQIPMAGSSKGGSELSNRIKCREFDYQTETTGFSTDIVLCGVRSQNYERMIQFLHNYCVTHHPATTPHTNQPK